MAVISVEGDYEEIYCNDLEPGDVVGYKFSFDQLAEFAKWFVKNGGTNGMVVVGEDRIADVLYGGDESYYEHWSIRLDEESNDGLYKFYDCWVFNPYCNRSDVTWYNEDDLICDIIKCFKSTDNIVFGKKAEINYYPYDDEDE